MEETKKTARSAALAARTGETLKVDVSGELRRCGYPILYLRRIQSIRKDVSDVTLDTSHLVLQKAPRNRRKLYRDS